MPQVNLTELEAALAKATPGPWSQKLDHRNKDHHVIWAEHKDIADVMPWMPIKESIANAEAIVLLRNQAPALLAELKALRKAVEAYQGMDIPTGDHYALPSLVKNWDHERDEITARLNEELGKV